MNIPDMEAVKKFLQPRMTRLLNNAKRIWLLISVSGSPALNRAASDDILRSAVVFAHATLEEFIRLIARAELLKADRETLNKIPFIGMGKGYGTPPKVYLGELVRYRGKTVDEVLQECIDECISRETFNNKAEVADILRRSGVATDSLETLLDSLNGMMLRRHRIVHQADFPKSHGPVDPIDEAQVREWVTAMAQFCAKVLEQLVNEQFAAQFEFKASAGEAAIESSHPLFPKKAE